MRSLVAEKALEGVGKPRMIRIDATDLDSVKDIVREFEVLKVI